MTQAYKVTLLIIDLDEIGAEKTKSVIENAHYPNRCISPDVAQIETADIGEWSDDHPLNGEETAPAEWRRLFPSLGDWSPKTMLDELTESQQKIVLATLHGVEMIIDRRDKSNRSFWRSVFNALWSMVSHGHAQLKKLFEE